MTDFTSTILAVQEALNNAEQIGLVTGDEVCDIVGNLLHEAGIDHDTYLDSIG